MVSGKNGCVHRVLRSILSQKLPGRPSKRRLGISIFFQRFFGHWHCWTCQPTSSISILPDSYPEPNYCCYNFLCIDCRWGGFILQNKIFLFLFLFILCQVFSLTPSPINEWHTFCMAPKKIQSALIKVGKNASRYKKKSVVIKTGRNFMSSL